uniref:Srp40 C-terminal domain-containing protein n=1 Tax=Hucho hucho TaxID=62062 RepID=A0A4W5QY83_9TELE
MEKEAVKTTPALTNGKPATPKATTSAAKTTKPTKAAESSSSEESSSEEEEASKKTVKPAATPKTTPAARPKTKEASSSSDDSSSSEEEEAVAKAPAAVTTPIANGTVNCKRKGDGEASSEDEEELTTPKNMKVTATTPQTFPKVSKKINVPFRRIREEEIDVDNRLADNSFDAKRGSDGDWGQRANDVLRFTKGKSFRHEKTKKKRGSYCGGAISQSVNSIKFDSD